jgi:ABC-type branched-chain amino acid transport systems, ATPase component
VPLLSIEDLAAGYDAVDILDGISLTVEDSSITAVLGANGAGKSTLLRSIVGVIEPSAGAIVFDGHDLTTQPPHEGYRRGVTLVPEDRGIFPELTVDENLRVPVTGDEMTGRSRAELYQTFPELADRRGSAANNLSGGEQQLLGIAQALRRRPQLLLLDEPSEGLAPPAVERLRTVIKEIAASGTAVFIVEQNAGVVLDLAGHVYVIADGEIVLSGPPADLRNDNRVQTYLGPSALR